MATEVTLFDTGLRSTNRRDSRCRPKVPVLSRFQQICQFLLLGVLATASYFIVSRCVLQSVRVVGASMVPTLHDADQYFLNRWAYYLHPPRHSDIVVVRDPTDGTYVVKRIIATPGEAVCIKNGEVFINGSRLWEPYLAPGTTTMTGTPRNESVILCGRDQYFVLGDNRKNSLDSRSYGPVRRQNILGAIIR